MKIEIIGLGVIGTSILQCLKSYYDIVGVDININILKEKKQEFIEDNNIKFYKFPRPADVFIVAVQTPLDINNKPDLSYFKVAISSIKDYLKKGDLIIINSTIPPGTMNNLKKYLETEDYKIGENLFLTYCPERILPGRDMLKEFKYNTRIISGDVNSCQKTKEIYDKVTSSEKIFTSFINAELIKLAENSYRDINIAFANEIAKISRYYNADIQNIIELANCHPRVNILQPGMGVGGHCIAIDPFFLIYNGENNRVLKTARAVNDSMPEYFYNKLKEVLPNVKKVTIFGYSYKPDIKDDRESPVIKLNQILIKDKIKVDIYDPFFNSDHDFIKNVIPMCENSDCIIIACNHTCFSEYSIENLLKIKNVMRANVMITPFLSNFLNWKNAEFEVINIFKGNL